MREKKHTREAICVLANISTETQVLKNPIKLPGVIERADIWVQSTQNRCDGFTIDVNIYNSQCLDEYFDYYFSEDDQKDILLANTLPPGFGCVIECKKT
jgi:hypothetical protein